MRLLAVALLSIAAPLAAQPDIAPYAARQIAPGVHLLATPPEYRGAVTGNITVIEQSDGVVVIDSGLTRADGRRAVDFIRSITRKPVKALLYTHWHNDHPQGGSEIRAAWPRVRIISTAGHAAHTARRPHGALYQPAPRRADRDDLPQSKRGHARLHRRAASQPAA